MNKFLQLLSIFLITSCATKSVKSTNDVLLKTIETKIDSIYKNNPETVGLLVHIEAPDKNISWTKTVGYSDKIAKTPINKSQPALIASNTKTYVAVAILRLVELEKLQLNEPIANLLTTKTKKALTDFGYDLNKITIKHLLSHTSGIKDYVDDDYFEYIDKNKKHRWTRDEQIQLATSKGKPLTEADKLHKYADVNYLLLTEIIENKTNKPFYTSIRKLLKFKALELNSTWFYTLEETPKNSLPLLHQYRTSKNWDSYDFDPSWDLYGGGGLASSIQDLALFFQYLFEGKIIADKNLLNELTTIVKAEKNNNYALGIRNIKPLGMQAYYHGGYWGTDVAYIKDLNTTVAIFNLERDERYLAGKAINPSILKVLKNDKKTENKVEVKNQTVKNALTAELDSIQKNGLINGFAVAMVNENDVLYTKGFGYANIETKEKYTENTIQHIASLSKTFIGIALMKAQELGKLNLDDPIQNYLPFKVINPNFPDELIIVRHLATHTSGINDTDQYIKRAWVLTENQDLTNVRTDYPEQHLNPSELNIPMEDYLKGYLQTNGAYFEKENYIKFKSGERYNYSNIGATLCALVIEKATNQSFDLFTKEHILKPLGMNATAWSLKDVDIKKHSRLYRNDNTLLPFYTAITYPDGMLISSSNDMAKYLVELIKGYNGEGTLLSKESYTELFKEQLKEENFASRNANHPYNGDYNPAIFIGHSALGYVGHSGGDAGVATWLYFDKEKKTGRYIVINTDMGNDKRSRELEYYAIWEKMGAYFEKLK